MYETAKHEFIKWLKEYKLSKELSPFEVNLLNVILNDFEIVASRGTAGGSRANYLISKISENNYTPKITTLASLEEGSISIPKVDHLQGLEVESFRGFSTNLSFDFSKQYSTFYGANGSGKSSLCEALEYCILGTVQEATARRIPLETFLKNKKNDRFVKPKLKALMNGNIIELSSNLEIYKFAFIEKNRIDSFSHISATTPSEKTERLAALFGLTEFTDFVRGFTESLDNKLVEEHKKAEEFNQKNDANTKLQEALSGKVDSLNSIESEIQNQIALINCTEIKELENAIVYLQDENGNGKIKEVEKQNEQHKKTIYSTDFFNEIETKYKKVSIDFKKLCEEEQKLISLSVNTNMATIYQAISTLTEDIDHTICPACKTPITSTVVNPFENAKKELEQLKVFSEINTNIVKFQKDLMLSTRDLNELVNNNIDLLTILNYTLSNFIFSIPDNANELSDVKTKEQYLTKIKQFENLISNIEIDKSKILEINSHAAEYNLNNEYTAELTRLRKIYNKLIELKGNLYIQRKNVEETQKNLKQFEVEKEGLKKAVERENAINNNKLEFKNAYKKIYIALTQYQKELPTKIANNLSEKVKEYYNIMNQDDASFEIIEELKMPISSSDNISIRFKDGIEENALQILSEGHVKLLGLAILLAKAKDSNQTFIILDDIVNAIDDEHRSGVAELLFENEDFSNVQIILTCHSESFIKRIEDCIPRNERDSKITRYVFITPITEVIRGIVVDYSNPKEPLELAYKDLQKNDHKDAAQKCRQAVESLINKLWKKLSNTYKIQISVCLPSPKSIPELSSITDGIIKQMKQFENETGPVLSDLQKLKSDFQWFILNKGTHYEDDQHQFELRDVRNLYDLLVNLEAHIEELKIKSLIPIEAE
ncbi:MAG: AAA family ATPase [Treponema sp.]|nr:AAA family ATPase [Treponema sp.]